MSTIYNNEAIALSASISPITETGAFRTTSVWGFDVVNQQGTPRLAQSSLRPLDAAAELIVQSLPERLWRPLVAEHAQPHLAEVLKKASIVFSVFDAPTPEESDDDSDEDTDDDEDDQADHDDRLSALEEKVEEQSATLERLSTLEEMVVGQNIRLASQTNALDEIIKKIDALAALNQKLERVSQALSK